MSEGNGGPGRPPAGYVGSGLNGTLTREDARGLMEEFTSSGKGLKAFAEERGMSSSRLGWWRTKFARELREGAGRGPSPAFVPVVVAARGGSAEKPSPLEVVLRTGQTVRVPAGFDERALQRLMAVLEGPRAC